MLGFPRNTDPIPLVSVITLLAVWHFVQIILVSETTGAVFRVMSAVMELYW